MVMYSFTVILQHVLIGFSMAFLGLLSPGLLTMTTLSTAAERGVKAGIYFAFGAIFPIIIQAHIALLGAEYLKIHPEIIKSFTDVAVFVFLILAIVFYYQYNNRNKSSSTRLNIHNSFVFGVIISLINPMAIPFYFTYSTLLEMQDLLILKQPLVSFFVAGAILGAFLALSIYAANARKLFGRFQLFAKHFKLLLAILMFILSLLSLYKSIQ